MADTKITGLTAVSAVAATNTLPLVEDPSGTPVTKKATVTQLATYLAGLFGKPGFVGQFVATGVNFNSANSDNEIALSLPSGFTRFVVNQIRISGASQTLTTATCSVWTAAGGTGTAIVASGTAITVSTASEGTANNTQNLTVATSTSSFRLADVPSLYFRVQTAQGAAATANVTVVIIPVP